MNVDPTEESKKTKPQRTSPRRSSHMRVTDETTPKTANTGENVPGPPTTETGNNSGKKFKGSEASPELPFVHLTRGDHHTSTDKFWAFAGVQFPGSRSTLAALIPTLCLPITEDKLVRQINDKSNYLQQKHNIKAIFILELDSSITTSGRFGNVDGKHSPLRVFRELADHPPVYFQAAPGSAKDFLTQKQMGLIRGFSAMPGIIESTSAAIQHTLSIRAPRAHIFTMVVPLKTYFHPRNKPSPRRSTNKRWHGPCSQRNALRRPHSEDTIQVFVPTSTPDNALSAVKAYLFPRNSLQSEIRGPGYRLQTVADCWITRG